MDFNERDQEAFEVLNERSVEFDDTEWDQSFQLSDRSHVNILLDISEDITSKEQEPFEILCLSGWEEAIQGWGRTTPLGCLIQIHRKEKRAKTGDTDHHHHCLLCIDILKLSEPHESELIFTKFPESCCDSSLEPPEKDTLTILGDFLNRSSSQTSTISSSKKGSPTESFRDLQKATQKLTLQGKMVVENDELCETGTLLSGSVSSQRQHHHHSALQCPIPRDRLGHMAMFINSFAILPPVKTCQPRHQSLPRQRGEASRGLSAGSEGASSARESTGVIERGQEMRATNTVPHKGTGPDDINTVPLTYKYWPTKQSHHFLPTFSSPKRCDMPISTLADPLPCVTSPLGRQLRRDTRTSSGHRLYFGLKTKNLKRPEPQLPILFGTRVPIPASAQRLL